MQGPVGHDPKCDLRNPSDSGSDSQSGTASISNLKNTKKTKKEKIRKNQKNP